MALVGSGLAFIAASISELVLWHSTITNIVVTGVFGAGLLVAGLVLLILVVIEAWLSRSQTALVDGLQAG
jgi:hypothetical protein